MAIYKLDWAALPLRLGRAAERTRVLLSFSLPDQKEPVPHKSHHQPRVPPSPLSVRYTVRSLLSHATHVPYYYWLAQRGPHGEQGVGRHGRRACLLCTGSLKCDPDVIS